MHSLQGLWPRPYSITKAEIRDEVSKNKIVPKTKLYFLFIILSSKNKLTLKLSV